MIKWLKLVIAALLKRVFPARLTEANNSGLRAVRLSVYWVLIFMLLISACTPQSGGDLDLNTVPADVPATPDEGPLPTAYPTREPYTPGTLVDYTAQTGDTLAAIAAHFNTTEAEIREKNPIIPADATTMPPGMPMKIPIYYEPLWGSSYQIIPDSLFINGPAQVGFDAVAYVKSQPGWFKEYSFYMGDRERTGGEIVDYIANNYSVSPRLLLAILEYQTGALTNASPPANVDGYALGYSDAFHLGVARQLFWVANTLNNGYYEWRSGSLDIFDLKNGESERPDPWQNAASVALHYYFAQVLENDAYQYAISGSGFKQTYQDLFGDPWENVQPHIPGSLRQPDLLLPFPVGKTWAYTGGPHTNWGTGEPYASLDFAPAVAGGHCSISTEPAVSMADGIVVRTGDASVTVDLDGDGDPRTGWVLFYLHLSNSALPKVGKTLKAGDVIGYPSCEGGEATGSHVHIARYYNGELISADGVLAFNLEGWVSSIDGDSYSGFLTRGNDVREACTCSDAKTHVTAGN
jgi:LasA protease